MKFWDSSAIVPLLAGETYTGPLTREYEADPAMLVWWGASVECASALARREREGRLRGGPLAEALDRLTSLELSWREVEPVERVRRAAMRLMRVHPLGSAEALLLGAALVAAEDNPRTLPFVTLDDELALAAEREGFVVVGPGLT